MMNNTKGQVTLEYMLLVAAVLVVMIGFLTGNGQDTLQGKLNATVSGGTAAMSTVATRLGPQDAFTAAAEVADENGNLVPKDKAPSDLSTFNTFVKEQLPAKSTP